MDRDRENELLRVKIVAMVGELKRIKKTIALSSSKLEGKISSGRIGIEADFELGEMLGKASMLQTVALMLESALKEE